MAKQEEKEYWEILEELVDTSTKDLITYVHLNNVYVLDLDVLKDDPLLIDGETNIIKDSVTLQTYNPESTNTIQVNYGKGDIVYHVTKQVTWAVKQFGEHKEEIDRHTYGQFEAEAYATKKLRKIVKKEGFRIDLSIIADPQFQVGKICDVTHPKYDIDGYYQISRLNFKYDAGKTPTLDLTLVDPVELELNTTHSQNKNTVSTVGGWRGTATRLKTPRAIREWIHQNIKYQKYFNSKRTVDQTFNDKRGNCWDQTDLAVAMMNYLGYNAWRVCGQKCNGIAHCNGRIKLNGKQITFDTVCRALNQLW